MPKELRLSFWRLALRRLSRHLRRQLLEEVHQIGVRLFSLFLKKKLYYSRIHNWYSNPRSSTRPNELHIVELQLVDGVRILETFDDLFF